MKFLKEIGSENTFPGIFPDPYALPYSGSYVLEEIGSGNTIPRILAGF